MTESKPMNLFDMVTLAGTVARRQLSALILSHGDDEAAAVLRTMVSVSFSNNLTFISEREMLVQLWESITAQSSPQCPLVEFLMSTTQVYYAYMQGQPVMPEALLAAGMGALRHDGDNATLCAVEYELFQDFPDAATVESLMRANRWYVVMLLLSMSEAIPMPEEPVPGPKLPPINPPEGVQLSSES